MTPAQLFLRFLKFGILAWGGPVAQIGMLHHELVEREQWVSKERFARVLAVYQVIPGPEAQELCVFFGVLKGGRLGGFLAGFAFLLPGFLMMLLLAQLYAIYGSIALVQDALRGVRPAVLALVLLALYRLGRTYLHSLVPLAIAVLTGAATVILRLNFLVVLAAGGLAAAAVARRGSLSVAALLPFAASATLTVIPSPVTGLLLSGLKAGLLSFGGAYTALPFLYEDAVTSYAWLSDRQFLDGLALHNSIPAPLVMVAAFVGFIGGGVAGAAAMTFGIFLPAFLITLVGHTRLEQLADARALQTFLGGVTAAVLGLMAATTISLGAAALVDAVTVAIGVVTFMAVWWRRALLPAAVLTSAVVGILA